MAIRKTVSRILKRNNGFTAFSLMRNLKVTFPLQKNYGFTLIELIVVIGMLSILLLALITTFNPIAQIKKAQDGQRQHDLEQTQQALDSYFSDTHCYPTTISFGSTWTIGSSIYMEKVPQDPDKTYPYVYEAQSGTCPQWEVMYAKLQGPSIPSNACPLASRDSCLPSNFSTSGYNYCLVSGNVDCDEISQFAIPQ